MDTRLTPLNVGLIPEDWAIKSLGEVSHRMTNGFVGQSLQYQVEDETGVMYIQGFNVRSNVIDLSKITYVCSKFAEEQQKSQLKEGDLLTVQSGHIGTTAVVPKELEGVNCHALIITRPKHDIINSNYVAYYLNSDIGKARLQGLHVGSTILHINTSELAKYRIPVPMLREQREIVAILSAWEKAIAQTEKLIEAKGKLKKGLMQQLLTGKRHFVGDSSTPKTVKLGEVAKIRRGASPRPIDDPKWFSDTGRGWVRISDVTACTTFLRKTSQYLSTLGESKSVKVNPGDLIMSICATIGVPRIVDIPACIHDGFVVLRDFEDAIDKYFLFHYISFITDRLAHGGQPGTQRNLNTSIVGNILIPRMPLHEQRKASDILDVADSEIALLSRQLEALKQQKRGLMQKLLTGQIRVKATEETTA